MLQYFGKTTYPSIFKDVLNLINAALQPRIDLHFSVYHSHVRGTLMTLESSTRISPMLISAENPTVFSDRSFF